MNRRLVSTLSLTLMVVSLFSVTVSPQLLAHSWEVKDTTEAWGKLFNIKGKLEVSNGRRDARMAAADGPIEYSFDAKLIEPGWYIFTFVMLEGLSTPYEVHSVIVEVSNGQYNNPKKLTVSPERVLGQRYGRLYIQPNEAVGVTWWYNPGGEGQPGGWMLKSVVHAKSLSGLLGDEGRLAPQ